MNGILLLLFVRNLCQCLESRCQKFFIVSIRGSGLRSLSILIVSFDVRVVLLGFNEQAENTGGVIRHFFAIEEEPHQDYEDEYADIFVGR